MQTFLPHSDFTASARVLDTARLGKQRVENLQILSALLWREYGWQHHPAVRMWRGHGGALRTYHKAICDEWATRGYADTCRDKFDALLALTTVRTDAMPPWLGRADFHASHRAALLHKNFAHYSRFGWDEAPQLAYIWPDMTA